LTTMPAMKQAIFPVLVALVLGLGIQGLATAHCEVPCGIYHDQQRFEAMLEDQETIQKAMVQIAALTGKDDALSHNQLARWVMTKEDHATKTQHVIAQYFMTQRIKASDAQYVPKLTAAHAVMVAAMKCKQNVDTKHADALRAAILAFHKVYEGK
jgi:nickel superoxide dismutase